MLLIVSKFTPSSPDLIGIQSAYAESFSFEVSPAIISISEKRPFETEEEITLSNKSQQTIELDIRLSPFVPSDSTGSMTYRAAKDAFAQKPNPDILKNVQLLENERPIDTLTLTPFQEKTVSLKVTIPPSEPSSDYYFSVIFLSNPPQKDEDQSATVAIGGIATHVLLSIGPNEPTNGTIEAFSTPRFIEHGPVPFAISIINKSNHFITPKGSILIRNMFGQTVGAVGVGQTRVLANSTRVLPQVSFNESFLLGPYEATLSLALSEEGPSFSRSIRFFAFPAKSFLLILASLFLLFWVRKRIAQKRS
ncbi:MAG: hypothetical protein A2698_00015 [Candidatus Levybacteria bacterium RIFCSPHIGHO2_01_FULL_42_15]|nr:MAG: hypothetical protein A2698_00015 [Candidatus Levybacteria bacterium RIFCSPHIGHO2_01_FULL_42_15]